MYSRPVEKPTAPSLHGAVDQRLHLLNFGRGGLAVGVAHHLAADAVVADQRRTLIPSPRFVSLSNQAASFNSEPPQLPVITVVTPSSRKLSARGLRSRLPSTWV